MRLTAKAHDRVASVLSDGDLAVDATAGNGHDSLWLAKCVGERGHVWALDVQAAAIASTRERLEKAGLGARVTLVQGSHSDLESCLPESARGRLAVAMFNLGYLPGSDRQVVTAPETTLAALEACIRLLKPGGLISLMVYRGHPGGQQEWAAISDWLKKCPLDYEVHGSAEVDATTPVLVCIGGTGP